MAESSQQALLGRVRVQQRALLAALVVVTGLSVALWLRSPPGAADEPLRKFAFAPRNFPTDPFRRVAAVAPNGRHIAYVSVKGGKSKLWIQDLHREEPRELAGTDGARGPFWSPDSEFVGFAAGDELKRIPVDGGRALTLCRMAGSDYFYGATWSPDGASIVFSLGQPGQLYEVSAAGGSAKRLFEEQDSQWAHEQKRFPRFLPLSAGGRMLLFARGPGGRELVLRDLETEREEVLGLGVAPAFSPTGHLLYQAPLLASFNPCSSVLWALPFSLEASKPTGEAFVIRQNASQPSVANDNTLVYLEGRCGGGQRLIWCDRKGTKLGEIGQPQDFIRWPSLSPDKRWVAATGKAGASARAETWIHDTARPVKKRLTFNGSYVPIWSPNSKPLTFRSNRNGTPDIFNRLVDGSQEVTQLVAGAGDEGATCWSLDGRYLLYDANSPETLFDIWYLRRGEEGKGWEEIPFLQTPFRESVAQFSPDGRFVAYLSDQSGRWEVHVRTFPEGKGEKKVSTHGGTQPRWSKDGKELFYVEEDTLVAASVTLEPSFSVISSTRLFTHPGLASIWPHWEYDVSADGQRFVVRELGQEPPVIRVVQNWHEEFRDREQD